MTKKMGEKIRFIPEEIMMTDIFTRLPVKSLLRFKSVCKSWYNLISDPSFVKLHLERSIYKENNNNDNIISLLTSCACKPLYSIEIDPNTCVVEAIHELVDINFISPFKFHELLCYCNGLVLFRTDDFQCNLNNSTTSTAPLSYCLLLINPCTRDFIRIPTNRDDRWPPQFRLVYDSNADDYKVMEVCDFVEPRFAKIYSLRSNTWTSVEGEIPWFLDEFVNERDVIVNGAVHWLGRFHPSSSIGVVCFDFGLEMFREFLIPDFVYNQVDDSIHLTVSRDQCLSIICISKSSVVDVFVMKEFGVKESWCKIYSAVNADAFRPTIYGFTNYDKILMSRFCSDAFFLYDPRNGKMDDMKISDKFPLRCRGCHSGTFFQRYAKSLVQLKPVKPYSLGEKHSLA